MTDKVKPVSNLLKWLRAKRADEVELLKWLRDRLYANSTDIKLNRKSLTFTHYKRKFKITVERIK